MGRSHDTNWSNPQIAKSRQTDTPPERVDEDSFSNRTIRAQIAADVARIRSAWLERNAKAELSPNSFNDQLVEMLVDTLDAHARGYLCGVDRDEQIPGYIAKLRRLGEDLYNDARQKTHLAKDASSPNQLLSTESRRKIIDDSVANLLSGSIHKSLDSSFQTRKVKERSAHKIAAATKLAEAQLAKDIEEWTQRRDEILFRIETRFSGRYQYWQAEALERVREPEKVTGPEGRAPIGVSKWEDVEIEFLSDDRVQIWTGDKPESRNYGNMGFMDKRSEKPNESWIILRTLAQQGGTLADSAAARKNWPAVEKQIQRIRKALRAHFGLAADPIPFVRGVGFRTRFKIRCAASFDT